MKLKKLFFIGIIPCLILIGIICFATQPKKPTVSVVMPTYNRMDLLPRAIESILNQTYKDFEFIIVDDGSTDDSINLIKSYQAKDKRIKLIQNKTNRGIAYSRNRGMDAARGKYLAIMDSDDYSVPHRLEKSIHFFKKHPTYTAVNSIYYEMGKEQNGMNNWVPPKRWEIIFNFANYYTNLAMFDLEFVRKHKLRYDETLVSAEDYDFWSRMWLAGGKLGMINEPLIWLRRHRTHPQFYYDTIHNVRATVSAKLLARFDISKEEAYHESRCTLMHKMIDANKTKKIVDQYVLELTYRKQCTREKNHSDILYVKHFDFVDDFIPTDTHTYMRAQTKEIYKLKEKKGKRVIFINPQGNEEIYRIQNDGSYALIENLQD